VSSLLDRMETNYAYDLIIYNYPNEDIDKIKNIFISDKYFTLAQIEMFIKQPDDLDELDKIEVMIKENILV